MKPLIILLIPIWIIIQSLYAVEPIITVTNQNLAYVRETRSMEVKNGTFNYAITDLPALLDPVTSLLVSRSMDFQVLEKYFEFDLTDLNSLLRRAIGTNITVVSEQVTIRGTLVASDGNFLFIETSDSVLQVIMRSPNTRISFDNLGQEYARVPTLRILAESQKSGTLEFNLSYLTRGMSWDAEYSALYYEKSSMIDLSAQVAISNNSGKSFMQARLRLMAGELHEVQAPSAPYLQRKTMAEALIVAEEEPTPVSEYKIFKLPQLVDLPDRQTRFIRFIHPGKLAVKKQYIYDYRIDDRGVNVSLTAINDKASGIGIPLPKGTVRIYLADDQPEYIGADYLAHTAVDEKIIINIGKAFDLKVERKVLEQKKVSKTAEQMTVQVELRNHKDEPVEILVREPIPYYRSFEIINSSHPVTERDARNVVFKVPVSARKTESLIFTILFSW